MFARSHSRIKPRVAARGTRHYRANLFQMYVVGAIVGFALLTLFSRRKPYFAADVRISRAVQRLDARGYHTLMQLVCLPGYPRQIYAIVALLHLWLYRIGLKWEALTSALSIVGMG